MPKVTALEPRTLHQPEKLQKLSKNDFVFTLFKNRVNQKDARITPRIFNRVQPVHRPMPENGAAEISGFRERKP
jgi:hypothetical protein